MRNSAKHQWKIPGHLLVAATAWLARILIAGAQLVSIRIVLSKLGTDAYAVFALLTSLMVWFMLIDFGIGYAAQNAISERRAIGEVYEREIVVGLSIGMVLLAATGVIFMLLSQGIGPAYLRQFNFLDVDEKVTYFSTVTILFLGTGTGQIIYKVWYGEQRGYLANALMALAALVSLGGLWAVVHSDIEDKLYWGLVAYLAPSMVLPLLASIWRIAHAGRAAWIFERSELNRLFSKAWRFWGFAAMSAAVLNIDYIIMSQYLRPVDIVLYTLTTKILGFALMVYGTALMALWPVCTELAAKNQWAEIFRHITSYLVAGAAVVVIAAFCFSVWRKETSTLFTGGKAIDIPLGLIALVAAYFLIRVWTDTFAMILQSISDLRPLWIFVPIQAILSGSLQWLLAPKFGLYGIVAGVMLSFLITVVWALPLATQRHAIIKNLNGISS